ncbi:blue-light-activated protein [Sphingomonas mucosissima]|uniref:histidine kinase n=2 Tax=Sphingomonas mucosissima TaxID=370959 RepID=A0A245ZJH8_9SPHN|nr:PAS domain-containing sensor histidine kinase [Sphingomonas mucosissima]OWK29875.1 blue-light-activated protein [Sphingomonas mucosissima]
MAEADSDVFRKSLMAGGDCGGLIAARDWSATPLGPVDHWPASLRTTVLIMLRSQVPMVLLWGEDGIMLYNDSYSLFAGNQHPGLLGCPVRDGWAEVADFNDHVMKVGLAGGTLRYRDQHLTLFRNGVPEPVWMDLDYSPVPDESGRPAGVLCILAETTERKLGERRLRDSEDRFRLMADAVPQITWITDAQGRTEFFNRYWWDYTGASPEPTTAAEVSATHLHPDDGAGTMAAFEEAQRTGTTFQTEHRIRSASGEYRWFLVRGEPYRDPRSGEIVRWFGASVDINDRKVAEEALRNSEMHLSAIFNQSAAGLAETDASGRFVRVNDRYCEIVGRTREGLMHLCMQDLTHPDDLGGNLALFQRVTAHAGSFDIVKRSLRPDGSQVWVHNSVTALRGPSGTVSSIACVSIDITDRKAAEDALTALNADLERQVIERSRERGLIWQHSIDLLSVIDLTTACFDAVNPAWATALGWSVGEIEGRPYTDFVHPDDSAASASAFSGLKRGEVVIHFENRYRTKAGGWRWLSWVAVPESGKLYSITRDVTADKEREAELETAQEALRQAQKMEAMGQLTGGVAHDFNNLLAPIVGSLDLLQRRGVGTEREQRLIAGAVQSAERAKTLVQRLLAFARRQPLQAVSVNIVELVAGMADLVASTTGPQIKVVVDAEPDLPPAHCDPNQLEMALLNLAVNARDAMPDGGRLRISATAEDVRSGHRAKLRPGQYVRLSVADTGTGMDQATLRRAIEPFFSTKGVGKGTGLGLSMAHGLASQLGGALTIQSRLGLGTNVELWLPRSAAQPDAVAAAPADTAAHGAGGQVLLVDDEDVVRMTTADMLLDLGYRVTEVASAEEAMRLIERGDPFDLLITDHLMPGLTGAELARAVRQRRPGMPVLLVSGYAEREDVGPDLPRLTKPFRKDELAASLAQLSA